MQFTNFIITHVLLVMGTFAIAISQAATASDPQTIISDLLNNLNSHSPTFTTHLQIILSDAKAQADTNGFNDQLSISIANTNLDAQGHNLVQSAFSGITINEKLKNLIALNSQSSTFDAQAKQFIRTLERIWCFDYLNGVLTAWRTAGIGSVVPGGLEVCGFDGRKGVFPAPGV
ncbi:hypothetical protein BGAL_0078g00360 [Botrytis galanthina]|uniref:Uncharacterized protein n=1 Tax=Botrytis galanthina TaxID=278940 RepID=A0A4S8R3M9_9HELO|nr:hypothetical protein BGAL_0078g00360 [Botrytis galanthina]